MSTPTDHRPPGGMTITEAAQLVGITREAIRLRIRRGKLAAAKQDGQWYVFLDHPPPSDTAAVGEPDHLVPPTPTRNNGTGSVPYTVLVGKLEAEVVFLRDQVQTQQRQLEEAARERSELRQIMALQLTHALPQGPPSPVVPAEPPAVAVERPRRWWWPFGRSQPDSQAT